jgi:hypothetical protein
MKPSSHIRGAHGMINWHMGSLASLFKLGALFKIPTVKLLTKWNYGLNSVKFKRFTVIYEMSLLLKFVSI